jgi:uncharacterized protein (DUF983 family)
MGMFDNVRYSAPCYACGAVLTDWQSKDGPCMLETVEPEQVQGFYTSCPNCKKWNQYKVTAKIVTVERVETDR